MTPTDEQIRQSNGGPKMGEFVIKRVSDDWQAWELSHQTAGYIMPLDRDQARRAMLGRYEPAALLRGELVKAESNGAESG